MSRTAHRDREPTAYRVWRNAIATRERRHLRQVDRAVVRDELAEIATAEHDALKIARSEAVLRMDRLLDDAYDFVDLSDYDDFEDYDAYYDQRDQHDDENWRDESVAWLDGAQLDDGDDSAWWDGYMGCPCCGYPDEDFDDAHWEEFQDPPAEPALAIADPEILERGRRADRRRRARAA